MIIRMTVHDNDFQDIMSGFVHNLYNGLTINPTHARDFSHELVGFQ